MANQKRYKLGINTKIVGKCAAQNLSYAGAWKDVDYTIEQLSEHISKGHPWMPALLDAGTTRLQVNSNYAELLALDIDNSTHKLGADGKPEKDSEGNTIAVYKAELTVEQAREHPLIKAHCALMQPSASCKPDWDKFRLVFLLPQAVKGWVNIRVCNCYLAKLLGTADPACKDASRFFFGAPGSVPALVQEVTLPASFVSDALAWNAEIERQAQIEQAKRAEYLATLDTSDQAELAKQALGFIPAYSPGGGTYNDLIVMMAGVFNELGAEGEALLEAWGGFGRETAKKVQGLSRTPNKKATLGSLFHLAKAHGFKFPDREFTPEQKRAYAKLKSEERRMVGAQHSGSTPGKVVSISKREAPQISYEQAIRELADAPPGEYSDLNFRWDEIATAYGKNSLDVSKAYHAVAKQNTEIGELQEAKSKIQRYLELGRSTLDLEMILGGDLANAFEKKAVLLGADPAVMLNQFLSVCASLAPIGTTVDLGSYSAKPIHWSVAIAPSGTNKSGTQYTMVAPLYKLQCEADERYQVEKKLYDREYRDWQKEKCQGDEPVEPNPGRVYVLDGATTEGIRSTQCQQPKYGFLVEIDEGTAFFKSFDQYRNGKGGDKEFYLKLHNGFGFSGTTKKHGRESCPGSNVSILLNTQPSAMQAQFGDFSDGEGMMSRFNPINQEYRRRPRLSQAGGKYEISDWLYSIYERLSLQPARQYQMEPQAFEVYAEFVEALRDRLEVESRDAMRSVISKMERTTATVIGLLHAGRAASEGFDPPTQIPGDVVVAGICFAEYLLGQVEYMRRLADEASGELDATLSKVLETAIRHKGKLTWLEARNIRALDRTDRNGKRVKLNRQQVEKVFAQLVESGFGSVEGEGGKMRFLVAQTLPKNCPQPAHGAQSVWADGESHEFSFSDEDLAS
jgi:Protein of unknown function (DUF3987)